MVFFSMEVEGVAAPEPIADPGKERTEVACPGTGSKTGEVAVEGDDDDAEDGNILGEG